VVIQLYKLAIDRTPEKSGVSGQEKILDAEYKMTSALSKYLMANKIKVKYYQVLSLIYSL
jgi:hypothetical protein